MQPDSIEFLKAQLASTNKRLQELEEWMSQHLGGQIGLAGEQYPHPDLKVRSLLFGQNDKLTDNLITMNGTGSALREIFKFRNPSLTPGASGDNDLARMGIWTMLPNSGTRSRFHLEAQIGNPGSLAYLNLDIDNAGQSSLAELHASSVTGGGSPTITARAVSGHAYCELEGITSFTNPQVVTIAGGAITAEQTLILLDTEAAAASDNLDTITVADRDGQLFLLRIQADARNVVVKHNTGNLLLAGSIDCTLDLRTDCLLLYYNASANKLNEISRGLAV